MLVVLSVCAVLKNRPKDVPEFAAQRISTSKSRDLSRKLSRMVGKNKTQEALELCQKTIEVAKRGSHSELAEVFAAAYEGLWHLSENPSRQVKDVAIDYERKALLLFKSLKDDHQICDVSRELAIRYAIEGDGQASLKVLDGAMPLIAKSSGIRSWYVRSKLDCLLALRRFNEAMQVGKNFLTKVILAIGISIFTWPGTIMHSLWRVVKVRRLPLMNKLSWLVLCLRRPISALDKE
jgi:hypothetical protein